MPINAVGAGAAAKGGRKARKGVNPFTKEPCTFKAKPASKTVRARAIKAIKAVV